MAMIGRTVSSVWARVARPDSRDARGSHRGTRPTPDRPLPSPPASSGGGKDRGTRRRQQRRQGPGPAFGGVEGTYLHPSVQSTTHQSHPYNGESSFYFFYRRARGWRIIMARTMTDSVVSRSPSSLHPGSAIDIGWLQSGLSKTQKEQAVKQFISLTRAMSVPASLQRGTLLC